jgi:hypothetical protein
MPTKKSRSRWCTVQLAAASGAIALSLAAPAAADQCSEPSIVAQLVFGQPPMATALRPTGIKQHSAVLRGRVDPRGADADYWFEYETTRGGGDDVRVEHVATAPRRLSACSGEHAVDFRAKGLRPGDRYTYWVVAHNIKGETASRSQAFRTRRPRRHHRAETGRWKGIQVR